MNTEGLKDLAIGGVSAAAAIWVTLEALKVAGWVKRKYAPLVAIGMGVLVSVANALWPAGTAIVVMGVGLGGIVTWVYAGASKMKENAKGGGQ
ncbi:MAG: hypothetical protein AB1609_13385 [Bacillota bacterium]|jgi:hypothetical protein